MNFFLKANSVVLLTSGTCLLLGENSSCLAHKIENGTYQPAAIRKLGTVSSGELETFVYFLFNYPRTTVTLFILLVVGFYALLKFNEQRQDRAMRDYLNRRNDSSKKASDD